MAKNDDLRKEIAKQYKAATNKIARTARTTGAKVGGSEFDPRRSAGSENRMRSTANMQEYLGNLRAFNSRSNQFIAGSNGAPLRKGYFNRVYKQNEAAVQNVVKQRDSKMGDIVTPTGFNVRQQQNMIPETGASAKYGPYSKFTRDASNITSQAALEKLNKDLVNKLKPDYLGGKLDDARDNIQKVAKVIGELDSVKDAMELSDSEFDLLWFGTNFAETLFLYYARLKEFGDGGSGKERKQDRVLDSQFEGLHELITWARDPEGFNNNAREAEFRRKTGQKPKRGK